MQKKAIPVDDFTKEVEERLAEKIERRKRKRRELAQKNKELKRKKKTLKMLKMKKNYGKGSMFLIKKLQPLKKRKKTTKNVCYYFKTDNCR